ncbi:MAG: helix-turn-helix domain-containing protein [Tenacibaculum sp.]|nr:helix-turn-helix domain-containing protein [Tenacibaculum sp.]
MKKEIITPSKLEVLPNNYVNNIIERITDKIALKVYSKIEYKMEKTLLPQTRKEENNKLLTIDEVCVILRKSRSTLNRWKNEGLLVPIKKIGVSPMYSQNQIDEFMKSNNE